MCRLSALHRFRSVLIKRRQFNDISGVSIHLRTISSSVYFRSTRLQPSRTLIYGDRFGHFSAKHRRSVAFLADDDEDLLESDDEESQPETSSKSTGQEKPPVSQLHYYYKISGVSRMESPVSTDQLGRASMTLQEIERCVADFLHDRPKWRTPSNRLISLLQRISSKGIDSETLLNILTILNRLPTRWTLGLWSANPMIDDISRQVSQIVIVNLSDVESLSQLNPDQMVSILNVFSNFYIPSCSSFRSVISDLLGLIGSKCTELSNDQMFNFLFSIGLHRIMPAGIGIRLEHELTKRFSTLNIHQINLFGFAFSRTDTRFNGRRALDLILRRTFESSEMDDFGIAMPLKLFNLNAKYEHANLMPRLADRFIENPPDTFSFHCWSHLASTCQRIRYYDEELAEKVMEKLEREFETIRLKDAALMLGYLTEIGHPLKQDVVNMVMTRLEQCGLNSPNLMVRMLFALSLRDVYPLQLIQRVLRKDYLIKFEARRASMAKFPARALFWLDCSVAVERPDYVGPRLDISMLEKPNVAALLAQTIPIQCDQSHPSLNPYFAHLSVAAHMIQDATGCNADCIFRGLILPHSPMPGLLLKFKNDQPVRVDVDQSLHRLDRRNVSAPAGEHWIAILVQSPGACKYGSTQFIGHHQAHVRQLEKLGYKVLLIHYKSLPRQPKENGVKRFERALRMMREKWNSTSVVY